MKSLKAPTIDTKLFFLAVLLIFTAILLRNSALYPSVFADEFVYSSSSRLHPIQNSAISNYLYLIIFRTTNICGDGFLTCARIINSIFFISAIPFLYQVSKRVCDSGIAHWICILALIGPINIYTAFYMPEAMYFFVFWLLTWYLLCYADAMGWSNALILGAIVAICSLTKPHGLFLLIPIFLYKGFIARRDGVSLGKFSSFIALTTFSFIFVKFTFGYFVAGSAGFTFLGGTYSASSSDFLNAVASQSGPPEALAKETLVNRFELLLSAFFNLKSNFWNFIYLWFMNFKGHFLSIFLIFGFPIYICVRILILPNSIQSKHDRFRQNLAAFTLIFITFLIFFSSLYSGLMGQASGERSIWRLHERYYNFAFPLFYICAGAYLSLPNAKAENSAGKIFSKEFLVAIFIVVIVGWAFFTSLHPYQPTSIDSPELRGFVANRYFFIGLSVASIILLIAELFRHSWAKWVYIFIWAPMSLVVGAIYVNSNMWERSTPDVFDRAGIVAKKLLSPADIDHLVVVGENPIELSRVLFYLSNPNVVSQIVKGGSIYEEAMLPKDKTNALVMDRYSISNTFSNVRFFDGFSLVGGHNEIAVSFDLKHWPSKELIAESGLFAPPESWGAWSVGKKVSLEFRQPLPEKFDLLILARAFGPNAGKSFRIEIGGVSQKFTLGHEFETLSIKVFNPVKSRVIDIYIPTPTSPKMLGTGEDTRMLGIALREIVVSW